MQHILYEIFTTILATITALLPIANPLTTIAVLPALAGHLTPIERAKQVKRACYYMAAILVVFLLACKSLACVFVCVNNMYKREEKSETNREKRKENITNK